MTKLKYRGPFADGVEIGDTGQYVGQGEEVEIDDPELAHSLLDQEANWEGERPSTPRRAGGDYDPGEHKVDDVRAYVEENPDQLDAVLVSERAGRSRSSLIEALEKLGAPDDSQPAGTTGTAQAGADNA